MGWGAIVSKVCFVGLLGLPLGRFDTGGYPLDPGHAVDLCIQLFTRSWEIHKAGTDNNASFNKEEDEIASEKKEPIHLGKRVRDEDRVCPGGPPKIIRQNGMDPLTL